MRPSEALALGRTLLKHIAGQFHTGDGGCALGMIAAAAPGEWHEHYHRFLKNRASLPCACRGMVMGSGCWYTDARSINYLSSVIVHIFNCHVMTKADWTMEQLIDWLRSVEGDESVTETTEVKECAPELVAHS